jgi:uncharacterized protein (DUF2141 family)
MLNKKLGFFFKNLLLLTILFVAFGCANQQKPNGGPRDVTPPRLLHANPPNMTRRFNAKFIQLDFDEYFKLASQYTEITMSPALDKDPEYKTKNKSLIIVFNKKDTLQKNTTYVINFGKAIQDVNEGNILKNFTYVFSTGNHIDSLSISGTVTNTVTQKKEKDITVMLFPLDKDSLYFGKKKPSIYTSTDSAGNFSLNNLAEGNYRIYALKETSPNKIYDRDEELIGFLKKPIHLYTDTSGIQLNVFKEIPTKFHVEDKFNLDGTLSFIFNRPLNNPSLKIIYPPALNDQKLVDFTPTNDTAYLSIKNMDFDSVRVAILENGKPIDSVSKMKGRKEAFQKTFSFYFNIGSADKLKPGIDLKITTTTPIDTFDPSLITLNEDSVAVTNFTIVRDSLNSKKFYLKYRWKEDSKYVLIIDDGAFTTIFGDKNKRYSKPFTVDKSDNYSNLTLKVTVPDTSKAYIVQFYQDEKNILQSNEITKNTSLVYKNFLTGKYQFRVIYDENRNGKWDTGSVKQKRYPENIWVDTQAITLRPNWDAEESLVIPRENVIH